MCCYHIAANGLERQSVIYSVRSRHSSFALGGESAFQALQVIQKCGIFVTLLRDRILFPTAPNYDENWGYLS